MVGCMPVVPVPARPFPQDGRTVVFVAHRKVRREVVLSAATALSARSRESLRDRLGHLAWDEKSLV